MALRITKRFSEIPFAHRQWTHKGHCAFVHGHNWSFDVVFESDQVDENGFILDFGKMDKLKDWFKDTFDHALVLSVADPHLKRFERLSELGLAKLAIMSSPSAEGLAVYVQQQLTKVLEGTAMLSAKKRGVKVVQVVVYEDSKNSATYTV